MSSAPYHLTSKMSVFYEKITGTCLVIAMCLVFFAPAARASASQDLASLHFNQLLHELSAQLITSHHQKTAPGPVMMVNFVDLSRLHCTSRFGQLVPERLRELLIQAGWKVLEARTGETIKLEEDTGPFILSDETRDLAAKVHCSAVLAGTYLFHQGTITVNAKLIAVADDSILAAASAETESDPYIFSLLRPEGFGCPPADTAIRIKSFSQRSSAFREDYGTQIDETYFKEEH